MKKKKIKRHNPNKYSLEKATSDDFERFEFGYNKMIFSSTIINNKSNLKTSLLKDKIIQKERGGLPKAERHFFDNIMSEDNSDIIFIFSDKKNFDDGFTVVKVIDKVAYIQVFTVYKHLEGLGCIFYTKLENYFKEFGISKIVIRVPYDGAQVFWRKMGFLADESNFESIIEEKFFKLI